MKTLGKLTIGGLLLLSFSFLFTACSGSGDNNLSPAEKAQKANKMLANSGVNGNAFSVASGADNQDQPAIAYDRKSNKYLTVWTDYQNGNADIYGKICDASTAATGLNAATPVCLPEFPIASGAGNQWQSKVAFDYTNEKYLVVLADTQPGYSIIRGQFVDKTGNLIKKDSTLGTELFNISTHIDIADPSQLEPDVIYNDFKNTFSVAWLGTSNYDTDDYPAATTSSASFTPTWKSGDKTVIPNANRIIGLNQSTTAITGYSTLPTTPDRNTTQATVTLGSSSNAIGTSTDIIVTYLASNSAFDSSTKPDAGTFAANQGYEIKPNAATQANVAFAYFFLDSERTIEAKGVNQLTNGPNLNFGITSTSDLIGLTTDVFWRSFQANTFTWATPKWSVGSPIKISNVYNGANTAPYSVTLSDGGDVTDQFDITISNGDLSATLRGTKKNLITGADTGIPSTLLTTNNQVTITYTPIKNLFGPVAGSGCSNSYGPVPYIPISHAGNSLIAYVDVSALGAVTTQTNSAYSQLVTKSITDNGSQIVQTWIVSDTESKPKLAYSPLDGNPFIVWSGSQFDETLTISYSTDNNIPGACKYSGVFTKNAAKAATPQKILVRRFINGLANDISLGTSAFFPAISIDPIAKRLLITWEEQGNMASTGKDINGQLLDLTNFVLYGNLINISNATGDQTSPSAAFDTVNQRHLIAWEDARNQSANISNMDIYGQFVDPQGNLSGGNVPISVAPGNQLSPTLAFGDVDFSQFLIIWKDAQDPANADLWGQLIKYSQLPQLVIADGNGSPILTGALDFGSVAVGQHVDQPIKLRNDGNSTLTLSPVTPPDAPFSFVTPTPVTINPGTAYDMVVRFAPTAAGSFAGNDTNNYKMSLFSNGGNTVLYFSGSGVGINPLTITTANLQDILPTVAADTTVATFAGTGGVAPYTWSGEATLPAALVGKLTFSSNGVLTQKTGVPAIAAGSYPIVFTLTDSNTPAASVTRTLTLNVGSIGITTTTLKTWTQWTIDAQNASYSDTLLSSGTTGTKTWSVPGSGIGSLPAGLALNTSTGVISGKPTVSGTFTVLATLSDSGTGSTVTKSVSITINPTPSIITSSLTTGVVAQSYSQTLTMAGGTLPITWSLNGSLPPGLTFNTGSGAITGTPTTNGTYSFDVSVTDLTQATVTKTLQIVINKVLDITTTPSLPNAQSGVPYTITLVGTGGTLPYSWSALSLPSGFALDPFTGVLTGTPNIMGTFSFVATLQDNNKITVSRTFTLIIGSPFSITTTALPNGTLKTEYNQQLLSSGGIAPITWSASTDLPAGLTLNTQTGIISGIPTTAGTSAPITFTATDTTGATATLIATITITNVSNTPGIVSAGGGGGGGGCFIATAAYGSYLEPNVMVLRHFRDDVLLQSELGTAFVRFYYKHSPAIADFIAEHDSLRMLMRFALTPLIFAVKYPLVAIFLLVIGAATFIARRSRRLSAIETASQTE